MLLLTCHRPLSGIIHENYPVERLCFNLRINKSVKPIDATRASRLKSLRTALPFETTSNAKDSTQYHIHRAPFLKKG